MKGKVASVLRPVIFLILSYCFGSNALKRYQLIEQSTISCFILVQLAFDAIYERLVTYGLSNPHNNGFIKNTKSIFNEPPNVQYGR